MIEFKTPDGMSKTLQISFTKAFEIIFRHGISIIEKTTVKKKLPPTTTFKIMPLIEKENVESFDA